MKTSITRWYQRRVPINRQGYDRQGKYWGYGPPIYRCHDETGSWEFVIRGTKDYARTACMFIRRLADPDKDQAVRNINATGKWWS